MKESMIKNDGGKNLWKIGLLFSLVFISGCVNVDKIVDTNLDESFISCPEEIGDFCIQVYDPVCGDDETYSNSCTACQNVERYKKGECK